MAVSMNIFGVHNLGKNLISSTTNLWSKDFASITCLPIAIVRLSGSQKSQIIFFLSIFSTYRYALVIGSIGVGTKQSQKRSVSTRKIGCFPMSLLQNSSPLLYLLISSSNSKRNLNFVQFFHYYWYSEMKEIWKLNVLRRYGSPHLL
jgi:hypothetical protein